MKNIRIFYLKISHFLVVKFSVYLNRHVFVMFVRRWFHMWSLFCHSLSMSISFGVAGRHGFVTIPFPWYLHLYCLLSASEHSYVFGLYSVRDQ